MTRRWLRAIPVLWISVWALLAAGGKPSLNRVAEGTAYERVTATQ
jgi:hypothetical protein